MIKQIIMVGMCSVLFFFTNQGHCAKVKRGADCTKKIQKFVSLYQKGKYGSVITLSSDIKQSCNAVFSSSNTLSFMLGKSYLNKNQSVEARVEFELLLQEFPQTVFREETAFLIGYCSYKQSPLYERDQEKTYDAIRELSEFIENYPQSSFVDSAQTYLKLCEEKLAKKEYMAARFYERVQQYEAAIVYYKNFIKVFSHSKYYEYCNLALAKSLIKLNRTSEAMEQLQFILDSTMSSAIKLEAKQLMQLMNSMGQKTSIDKKEVSTN